MIFRGLDANFVLLEEVPAINMQWNRRYYECGDFEAQLRLENYNINMQYIWHTKTNEVGVIEKIEIDTSGDANYIYLSGRFIESWLSRGVVMTDLASNNNVVGLCRSLVNARVITDLGLNKIQLGAYKTTSKTTDAYPDNETEVGAICRSLLKSIEYGQKLDFDYETKKFKYTIYQGVDRTIDGQHVVFSDSLGNVSNINYSNDTTNYKNYADIRLSRGGDPERILYTSYNWVKDGEPIQKLRLDVSQTDDDISDAQAIAEAQEKGMLELLNHRVVENANFEPVADWFEYMKDWDLGDVVDLVISSLEVSASFRIVGVDEVYKDNRREITPQFGDLKFVDFVKGWY